MHEAEILTCQSPNLSVAVVPPESQNRQGRVDPQSEALLESPKGECGTRHL